MPFCFRSLICTAPSTQGHVEAAWLIGIIYYFAQGVAVDYKRALAATKIGAEGGNVYCQHQLGYMLMHGHGMDSPDYTQALVWLEKAAAQDHRDAVAQLALMIDAGRGCLPSWRRARELNQRAIALGCEKATRNMQLLNDDIQKVTRSHAGNQSGLPSPPPPSPPSSPPS